MGSTGTGSTGTGTMGSTGSTGSTGTGSTGTGTMGSTGSTGTGTTSNNTATWNTGGSANGNVYNGFTAGGYAQNPAKYIRPAELFTTGGWTYNTDWRVNTNFTPEAVGQWQLEVTPEVSTSFIADTSNPKSYASYWTPEATLARQQAAMAAAAAAATSADASMATTGTTSTTGSNTTTSANSTGTSDSSTGATTGSGTTGTMGSAGSSTTTGNTTGTTGGTTTTGTSTTDNTGATGMTGTGASSGSENSMTAVNGNKYMMPRLNLYLETGSFIGYTGCNNIVGKVTVDGNKIHFAETVPSTNIACTGGFDQAAYMDKLRRADNYDVVNNQLRLKQGDQVLMVLAKNAQ
jgi:heat shock protein HslJ